MVLTTVSLPCLFTLMCWRVSLPAWLLSCLLCAPACLALCPFLAGHCTCLPACLCCCADLSRLPSAAPRCNSWTGLLHEDAFEDDLLDQLLNLHMRPQLQLPSTGAAAAVAAGAAAGAGLAPTTDGVWQQLQQQQYPQQFAGAGAAAAAVEAAVAAINALMTGTSSLHGSAAGTGDGRASTAAAGTGGPGRALGPDRSGPSFYKALMATGGMIRPPGGPTIPLNVDFATEIQPYLGRLLGKGGFGHVYEATWRGQKVGSAKLDRANQLDVVGLHCVTLDIQAAAGALLPHCQCSTTN